MSNSEYYKEWTIYYLTDYEWNKRMDIQNERTKEWRIKTLERMVNILKDRLPKDNPHKKGKVIKLNSKKNTKTSAYENTSDLE